MRADVPAPTRRGPRASRRLLRRWATRARLYPKLEIVCAGLALLLGALSYMVLSGRATSAGFTPPTVTLLLVATLVPVMGLIVLLARRIVLLAINRREGRVGARLHLKLVALFAGVAAAPTLLVVAFAALLFQYGVQFWFSDRARAVLENADRVAQAYVVENKQRIVGDIVPMATDIRANAADFGVASGDFARALAFQVAARGLTEAAVFAPTGKGVRVLAAVGLDPRPLTRRFTPADLQAAAAAGTRVLARPGDRVEAIARVDRAGGLFLYASRKVDPKVLAQAVLSRSALNDYHHWIDRSRALQFRFNLLLGVVSLLLLAGAIWAALRLATRLATPIGRLAQAAERVGEGDLSARVAVVGAPDELAGLARAFNRMAGQLGVQQRALMQAGEQMDRRRQLTEAVLAGVSAGVLSVDGAGVVRLLNASAAELLGLGEAAAGARLETIAPELAAMLDGAEAGRETRGEVAIARGANTQTLAVRVVRPGADAEGAVVTFDDISAQLADQRRAAWADVARRIAHEIKNPLTPIQLSAERLQRKYGAEIVSDPATFAALTSTIVRQVGDLRRMVDEFSAFARMPAPEFAWGDAGALAREAVLLQEVAWPGIVFAVRAERSAPMLCDRRQIARALTNVLQNAAQAVAARQEQHGGAGHVTLDVTAAPGAVTLTITDDGPGLPVEGRARLTEPYVTTRARGTGLGLAIVKKIVEEHDGVLDMGDAPGGGAVVTMCFDTVALTRRLTDASAELGRADASFAEAAE